MRLSVPSRQRRLCVFLQFSMRRACLLFLGIVWSGLACAADSVLVVSIDALHPDALGAKTSPTLHALMQPGHHTLQGRSVTPPKTLIGHAAMLTGLPPQRNGKLDNDWQPGEPQVSKPTLFDDARQTGYRTAYYYSKPKLGYLVNAAVGEHGLEPHEGIERVRTFFRGEGRRLAFLHVSGLEWAGGESGWLTQDYLDELTQIDAALAPLFAEVSRRGRYAVVVTSDHAGHDRQHGTDHPEDYKLPLILAGNVKLPQLPPGTWPITELRALVRKLTR
jgi:predicted AlkP superfamily pyrophosphatase or phosphodiesterase